MPANRQVTDGVSGGRADSYTISEPVGTGSRRATAGALAAALAFAFLLGLAQAAGAQGDTTDTTTAATPADATATEATTTDGAAATGEESGAGEAELEQLRVGAQVYTQICSQCHQPGGAGLPGSYPPLLDNPNTADAEYVRGVINNGRQGEIVVNGETYNGIMPSFSTLSDEEVTGVIAYIQAGFQAPAEEVAVGPTGPVAGTELPGLANMGSQAAFLIAAFVVLLVLGPRITSRNSRLNTPWLDAALKVATIVVGVVLAVAYLPNWVLQTSVVAELPRFAQDLIGVSVWGLGLVLCFGAMWYAHREERI